jgi:hydrophobe/amphiphile efflux-1 (HAE1) family protein
MSLPELSIRRPVFAWMLMAAIILFGCVSFTRLGISQLPDVDFPVVGVSLSLPGAAPEVMESQVIDQLEDAIMEIDGIRNVTSSAQQASGSISVEFELNRDIDKSMQLIQNKINQVKNLLPTNLNPPTLRKTNPEDQPILWLAVSNDDPNIPPAQLMMYARNVLFDQFASVPGVGNIALGGYVEPALRVWANIDRLQKYEVTASDLLQSIFDGHLESPSGIVHNAKNEYNVRLMGEAQSPEQFGLLSINNRGSLGANFGKLQLKDVAKIEEGVSDVRKIARFNGKRTVGLGIMKQHGSNAVEVASAVRKKLAEIKPLIPPGWSVAPRNDSTRFIKQSVEQLIFNLVLSALLTSLVCYLFLGSITSTINVLMAIPTSIIGTFTSFFFFHFTLNTFTLLGLSLAIGIVVDDAIMMLENIVRHRELGQGKKEAALNGATEITFAAMAATIAVVAIFMPVVFMQGVIGRYFLQYGVTVTVAVLLSLLEALTLTPMRCSRYLHVDEHPRGINKYVTRLFDFLSEFYRRILEILLNHRWKTIILSIVFFALSILLAKKVPSEMLPAQDQSQFLLRFKLPVGTALPVTDAAIKVVEDYMREQKEVEGIFAVVGGFGGDAVNQGMAFVTLVDPDKRKLSQGDLVKKYRQELRKKVKGMEVIVQDLSLRGFAASRGFPVEFTIQGPNWEKLTSLTDEILAKLKESPLVADVNTDIQPNMQEVKITPARELLAKHGVSVNTVTTVINALVGGAILNGKTMYPKDGHRYMIELRLISDQRDEVMDLNRIMFRNNRGQLVRLSDLVKVEVQPSLMLISRLNRQRSITAYANPAPGVSQQEAMKFTEKLARSMVPGGYSVKMTGSSQSFQESMRSLIVALLLGILVSYMVLGSQFNSFVHPISVLMALPFSFSGALIALYIAGQSINIYSMIGFILLMGIVKKNSILLVDFTNVVRSRDGLDVRSALLKSCPVRLRPILMTSVAVIAGALPEALSLGPGSETAVPMAVAIIGGVIASTVLTLFVVPCVYSLLAWLERKDTIETAIPVPATR